MPSTGCEHPLVRYYRIEYANEYQNFPGFSGDLTPSLVRSRLGIPEDCGFASRLFRRIKSLLVMPTA